MWFSCKEGKEGNKRHVEGLMWLSVPLHVPYCAPCSSCVRCMGTTDGHMSIDMFSDIVYDIDKKFVCFFLLCLEINLCLSMWYDVCLVILLAQGKQPQNVNLRHACSSLLGPEQGVFAEERCILYENFYKEGFSGRLRPNGFFNGKGFVASSATNILELRVVVDGHPLCSHFESAKSLEPPKARRFKGLVKKVVIFRQVHNVI